MNEWKEKENKWSLKKKNGSLIYVKTFS